MGGSVECDLCGITSQNTSWEIVDGEVIISGVRYVNTSYVLYQESEVLDLSEVTTTGTYYVDVTLWTEDDHTKLSMSNATVDNDSAVLVVNEDGTKEIYFETQAVTIGSSEGYANNIWYTNNSTAGEDSNTYDEFIQLNYYSYILAEDGSTDVDGFAEEYGLYYPAAVGFTLPDSAETEDGVYLEFSVPIMDYIQGYTPGSGEGSRIAFMTLSNIAGPTEVVIPTYDESVLVVAIDSALSSYSEEDYNIASYEALTTAIEAAQSALDSGETLSEETISSLSSSISTAIESLVEAEDITESETELTVELADTSYTYTGSEIEPEVTLSTTSYTYSGSAKKPSPTVVVDGITLTKGTDYTVSYRNNTDAGTALIVIRGIGNYTGSITKTFTIKPGKVSLKSSSTKSSSKKKLTVAWSKKSGGVKYQIAYRQKGSITWKYRTVSASTYKKTISGLKSGKKYVVKVRAYKTVSGVKYYGSWSSTKTVKVK